MGDAVITTERLTIRPFAEADLADLTALIRDKMAAWYAPYDTQWPTDDASMAQALAYLMGEPPWSWSAVALNATGRVIGFVCAGLTDGGAARELGYTIRSDQQNRGYACEACRAVMAHCAEVLGTRRFVAGTADCNLPSVKLLHKLGFVKVESLEAAFANDAEGNPIAFPAGRYERII